MEATVSELDRSTIVVVAVVALAAFMAVLDGTIVTVAIDTFADVFDARVSTVAWVSVAYLLAAGSTLPASGWAIARFGGRRVFLAGLVVFVAGSALASTAWSAGSLIAFRVLQGLGGGVLEPTALTLAAETAGPRRVGRVMGVLSLIINVAPVLGPLAGGVFATPAHWRWIFLLNLPIGALVATAALLVLPGPDRDPTTTSVDMCGLLLLSPGFVALLLAIDRAGARGTLVTILLPTAIGLALLGRYGRRARRVAAPVVDLRLLRNRAFAASVAVMAIVGFVMYSQLLTLPVFLRRVHGFGGVRQGMLTTALGVGLLVSMSWAGPRSDRTGARPLVGPGASIAAAGLLVFAFWGSGLPVAALMALFVAVGLGFGAVASPTFAGAYRTVPPGAAGQATTAMFIVVQLSASFGVTVVGLVLSDPNARPFGAVFALLAAAVSMAGIASRLLPGSPRAE